MVKLAHRFAVKALKRKNKKQNNSFTVWYYFQFEELCILLREWSLMLVSRWSEPGWELLYEANRKGEQLSEGTSCPRGWAGPLASCFSTLCAPRSKTKPASPSSLRNNTCHTHTQPSSASVLLSPSFPSSLFFLHLIICLFFCCIYHLLLSFSSHSHLFFSSCLFPSFILLCFLPLILFCLFPPHFLYANDFRHLFPLLHSHLLFTSSSSLVLYFMLVLHTF